MVRRDNAHLDPDTATQLGAGEKGLPGGLHESPLGHQVGALRGAIAHDVGDIRTVQREQRSPDVLSGDWRDSVLGRFVPFNLSKKPIDSIHQYLPSVQDLPHRYDASGERLDVGANGAHKVLEVAQDGVMLDQVAVKLMRINPRLVGSPTSSTARYTWDCTRSWRAPPASAEEKVSLCVKPGASAVPISHRLATSTESATSRMRCTDSSAISASGAASGRYSPSIVMLAVNPPSGCGCTATKATPGAPTRSGCAVASPRATGTRWAPAASSPS